MSVVIYHNPRCSKSRETLNLLKENNVDPDIIEYLKTPPSADELATLLKALGISARDLLRKKEAEYKAQGLDNPDLSEREIIEAMVKTPKLMERPIVVKGKKAAIGRPPEKVLEIL